MRIYIKNMVSERCKAIVCKELKNLGLEFTSVELGEAFLTSAITTSQRNALGKALEMSGLTFLENSKDVFVQKVKKAIIQLARYSEDPLPVNLSEYLSTRFHSEYTHLAHQFSEMTGVTVERFFIWHKIERVKELLFDDNNTLSDIAFRMHYSSVAHVSNQFKKVTGQTPSHFRRLHGGLTVTSSATTFLQSEADCRLAAMARAMPRVSSAAGMAEIAF